MTPARPLLRGTWGAGQRPRGPVATSRQATLWHTPGRTGRSPKGPLVGEMPRTMQSNRKLICSPSAEDRKKTPAPAGDRPVSLARAQAGASLHEVACQECPRAPG